MIERRIIFSSGMDYIFKNERPGAFALTISLRMKDTIMLAGSEVKAGPGYEKMKM
ncbi:unnamed protein product [Amoebophrya sp. A25]|nr:unnamed protein product [Amoebophrya sp. A25]|eukprot:GSA25T00016161001.1